MVQEAIYRMHSVRRVLTNKLLHKSECEKSLHLVWSGETHRYELTVGGQGFALSIRSLFDG